MPPDVRDLTSETLDAYLCCGTQPTPERVAQEALKCAWTRKMASHGHGAKIAYCDGKPAGFTNFMPIEVAPAPVKGEGALFVMCIHVNDADDEPGVNYERRGVGTALVEAVEAYARENGFCGVATIALEADHLPAAFWRKAGYQVADQGGLIRLMWKPFAGCDPPSLWKVAFEPPARDDGRVHVDVVYCSFCSWHPVIGEIADSFGDRVAYHEHVIDDREVMDIEAFCGHVSLFVDGERKPNWPVGEEAWREMIAEAVGRLPGTEASLVGEIRRE